MTPTTRRRLPPLLALLGHELRAPAGVVGGYLALLEQGRDSLTPDQQKALAGARKAQQALVDALDDLRIGEARHGVDVTFDLDAASAPPPPPFDAG